MDKEIKRHAFQLSSLVATMDQCNPLIISDKGLIHLSIPHFILPSLVNKIPRCLNLAGGKDQPPTFEEHYPPFLSRKDQIRKDQFEIHDLKLVWSQLSYRLLYIRL